MLGPTEAIGDDGSPLPVGGPKQRTVLAVLALCPGEPVSTDRLIDAVWGDEVPVRAARSLSTYVSNLRRVLGEVIVGSSGTYTLTLARSDVDARAFEDLLDAADRTSDQRTALEMLQDALALWRGSPFEGIDQHGAFTTESVRLDELRVSTVERVIQAEIASGRHGEVIPELATLVERHPLRALHMRALYGAGRQADALGSYRKFKEQLPGASRPREHTHRG